MSYFSTALTRALEEESLSQSELARTSGVGAVQINRYLRDRSQLQPDILVRILKAFSEDHQSELIRGYLMDRLPSEFAERVVVLAKTQSVNDPKPDGLDYLPESVRNALRYIGSRCHDQNVFEFVTSFERLLRGDLDRGMKQSSLSLGKEAPSDQPIDPEIAGGILLALGDGAKRQTAAGSTAKSGARQSAGATPRAAKGS